MQRNSWFLIGVLAVAMQGTAGAQGRPLNVSGTQLLDFGAVLPGVQQIVPWNDAASGGRFSITGAKGSEVRLTFTLPASLIATGGRTLPLQFGPSDGAWNTQNTAATASTFDPRVPLVTRLSNQGRLFFWLGGKALPSGTQAAGTYNGSITLTAMYTGN
jgi:uncharacterized protein DUF4402